MFKDLKEDIDKSLMKTIKTHKKMLSEIMKIIQ